MGKPVQQSDIEFYYQDMELLQPVGKIHPTLQTDNLSKITGQPSSKTQLLCAVVQPCVSSTPCSTKAVRMLTSALRIRTEPFVSSKALLLDAALLLYVISMVSGWLG